MTKETRKIKEKTLLGRVVLILPEYIDKDVPFEKNKTCKVYHSRIPGIKDNGDIFAYLIGMDDISKERQCRIIGIVHGKEHDKLVAAPIGKVFDQMGIAEALNGKENDLELESYYHRSCGAVVYRWEGINEEYLILRGRRSNKWTFPKGHMEKGESERETAIREVFEEAGFTPCLEDTFREELHYRMSPVGEKTVVLFLAEYDGNIRVRADEIRAYAWADYDKAEKMLDHENFSRVLKRAHEAIINKHSGN
ncbi:MAG: NUDIX domain-containing protein [Ruminococcaceae bacterium]|nr:NUDIX domain-containing protein [Oscillospiraceae bacterium]